VSDQATALGPKFFVLGAFVQSVSMMDTWKARGVNTLVETPEGNDALQWAQAADAKGLYQIRHPSTDLHFDINDRYLLAWATRDEPSDTASTLDYGVVAQDPAEVTQEAAAWRAAAQAEGKFVPVWTNHIATHIFPDWAQTNALMHDYMQGAESDWLSADSYQIQNHQAFVIPSNDGYTSTSQGVTVERQLAWSGGKPVMAFIGTSAFGDTAAAPTAAQFNAMAWSSVIHGASGITYFPVDLQPFAFDITPPDVVQAMTIFDQEIAAIDKILMNETAGGRDPFTVFRSANPGEAVQAGQLPYPFEATEIQTAQGPYRIILNLSDQAQVLNKPEWGLSNVTFQAYEVQKGYAAAGGGPSGTAGDDILQGGAAADVLSGGDGRDYIRGDAGDDQLSGGAAFDDLNGNTGNDTAHGGLGDDWVVGGKDNDALFGDEGSDVVWGNLGADTQDGGDGNDQVRGGQGDDSVAGGAGDDFVSGDRGNDTISGGPGADLFHGSQDAGIDRVLDFHLSEGDRVLLDPGTTYTLSQVGSDTVIDMGGGHQMILAGVQLATLTPGWLVT